MTTQRQHAVTANLDCLAHMLDACAKSANEASTAYAAGRHCLAIGTIRPLEQTLIDCTALLTSTMALARFQTSEDGRLL